GAIEDRLVARTEVDKGVRCPVLVDLGMPPAHSEVFQHDVALRQATDHCHIIFQVDQCPGKRSCQMLQGRHWTVLRYEIALGSETACRGQYGTIRPVCLVCSRRRQVDVRSASVKAVGTISASRTV